MKILYAIQGTGNGHLTRARDVYPELCKHGDVDVLISGIQADVAFPHPVKYKRYGMSFIFGKNGGVDIWRTISKSNLLRLLKDIRTLPVKQYDLIINDFEPVSAWACRLAKKQCIALSHQSAVLHPMAPRPEKEDKFGKMILQRYAPFTEAYSFHFKSYGQNIFTPIIRQEVRQAKNATGGHYTVYLPAYDDEHLVEHLSHFKEAEWRVFSKHNKQQFTQGNVQVQPIENAAFIASMASGKGVLCGAGFEGPTEALFLQKKLMVVPMLAQYEQQCNAAALAEMGVPVIKFLSRRYYDRIRWWLMDDSTVAVDYPDHTSAIIAQLVQQFS